MMRCVTGACMLCNKLVPQIPHFGIFFILSASAKPHPGMLRVNVQPGPSSVVGFAACRPSALPRSVLRRERVGGPPMPQHEGHPPPVPERITLLAPRQLLAGERQRSSVLNAPHRNRPPLPSVADPLSSEWYNAVRHQPPRIHRVQPICRSGPTGHAHVHRGFEHRKPGAPFLQHDTVRKLVNIVNAISASGSVNPGSFVIFQK